MGRTGISHVERKAIRSWTFSQHPRPRQKAIVAWFEAEFARKLSQSTISESLDDRFQHLDAEAPLSNTAYRVRAAAWPILEAILYEWQQKIEAQGALVSGDLLADKAREIWLQIPTYQGQTIPEFSSGWVTKFKQRWGIKEVIQHGEQSSVPQAAAEEMTEIRDLCLRFPDEDIFNMDETGLFWRWAISRGLATTSIPGVKKDKSRVSIILCSNATGTERLPPWVIGKAKQPRALRGVNISAIGCVWRASTRGWVNQSIIAEWLSAFYSYVENRKVLLLMDNFSAHLIGLQLQPPPLNITVQLLPKNSTSLYQPLDQGIIKNFKSYYRKQWLQFSIEHYNQSLNPFDYMTLLSTLRWVAVSWLVNIKNSTTINCYIKSTCIPKRWQAQDTGADEGDSIEQLYQAATQTGHIRDAMAIENFLNPIDEDIEEDEEATSLQDIITNHLGTSTLEVEEDDTLPPPAPTTLQALQAVRTLLHYQEYQDGVGYNDISYMRELERSLAAQSIRNMRQSTISEWLQPREA